ncbi:MAG: fused MFS/spermidine synthase [Gemmataceae bacterium]|nr:fused MFS/spermidine synthase [Gemmataceae bacterium]
MLPGLFAATLFTGAALLFLVQPLAGKLLLPLVGGTPAAWNSCLVFFQALLLAGYLYAHRSVARLGVRRQAIAHLAVLSLVLLAFAAAVAVTGSPVAVFPALVPADQDYPIAGVVALLAVAVGLPFLVLSTTAPLLQRWFAATGHPAAVDPYYLYAASNAGSLVGLLAYPFVVEPTLALPDQQWAWAAGVAAYLLMVTACATAVRRARPATGGHSDSDLFGGDRIRQPAIRFVGPQTDSSAEGCVSGPDTSGPAGWRVARWVGLAALPSSLLMGVTAHLSTDLAPVPLLWVVPLALYLVSFVVVFARWPAAARKVAGRVTPMLVLFAAVTLLTGAGEPLGLIVGLHLAAFFGVCLVCHGELASDRPPPDQLTGFYFWMSVGGVLGGAVNALVAPVLFHRLGMVEYPLALILAGLVRPRGEGSGLQLTVVDVLLVLGLFGLAVGLVVEVPRRVDLPADGPDATAGRLVRGGLMYGLPAVVAFALVARPARFALALAALFAAGVFDPGPHGRTLHRERNFFGLVRVTRSPDGRFVRLVHGTTLHGQQRTDEPGPPRPMTYYHEKGPVGHLFRAIPPDRIKRVGVVGLGTGAMAAYARPGQAWTFYEIDPAVARVAADPRYFTFLASCRGGCEVVLGDARRQLARAPDGTFDVLVLDAFSSDAIPVHLLTREALALYVRKLAPGGVLALHLSNNHLDLPPLVDRLAKDHDPPLAVRYMHDGPSDAEREDGKTASVWMVLARSEADLGPMARGPHWHAVPPSAGPLWRDDFANLLSVWKSGGED